MPCRVFYDSRPNTTLNKLLTGGPLYSVRFTVETHSVLLFHVEMSIRRAVQQALTPSKCKDGRLRQENRRLLSYEKFAENVRPLNLQ